MAASDWGAEALARRGVVLAVGREVGASGADPHAQWGALHRAAALLGQVVIGRRPNPCPNPFIMCIVLSRDSSVWQGSRFKVP